ncbi:hypothetical protein [Lyngbya sp. PCC 8106]|uniref:hypothetical protein n=1 Tax=Lyngbya sp. (strain PCC 8106) TaxID=313612 RepID=UPI0000EAA3DE|nr:hypothetical protein [Lyngbya sp. PCC 8106]EAW34403.1 hypothetical protein L8106_20333 [Lyngbya sp. PCC 8106]
MNSTDTNPQKVKQRLLQLAKQGNPKAIVMLLNRFSSQSENISTFIEDTATVQNNYLNLKVESSLFPLSYLSKKHIYDVLKLLKIEYIEYVIVEPKIQKDPKKPCKERIDLTKELETHQSEPEPSDFQKFKWPAWFPYPSSWLRMIVLILWLVIVVRIFAFWGVVIGGTVSVVSDDPFPLLQALIIGFLGSIIVLSCVYQIISYLGQISFRKSSLKSFQWLPTPLNLWQGIYTPIVLILSVLTVFLVILPFIPWGSCQTELLFEDKNCHDRIQNYLASLEVLATIVWITSGLYLYQLEYLIRTRVSAKKVIKFIALVCFSFMSTVLIYTTATNWNYIYGAFSNIESPFSISESSEVLAKNKGVEAVKSPEFKPENAEVVTPEIPDISFKKGIENATNASLLVQTAKSKPEWEFVAIQWQNAIDYMKQVQPDDVNYKAAQERVVQYQKNLEYARLAQNQAKE